MDGSIKRKVAYILRTQIQDYSMSRDLFWAALPSSSVSWCFQTVRLVMSSVALIWIFKHCSSLKIDSMYYWLNKILSPRCHISMLQYCRMQRQNRPWSFKSWHSNMHVLIQGNVWQATDCFSTLKPKFWGPKQKDIVSTIILATSFAWWHNSNIEASMCTHLGWSAGRIGCKLLLHSKLNVNSHSLGNNCHSNICTHATAHASDFPHFRILWDISTWRPFHWLSNNGLPLGMQNVSRCNNL